MMEPTPPEYSFVPAPRPSAVAFAAIGVVDLIIATVAGSILAVPFLVPVIFSMLSGRAVVTNTRDYTAAHKPATDAALVAWGRKQRGIQDFMVQRKPNGVLELSWRASITNGSPVLPPWWKLGYTKVIPDATKADDQVRQATMSLVSTENVLLPVVFCSSAGVLAAALLRLKLRAAGGTRAPKINYRPTLKAVGLGVVGAAAVVGFDQVYEYVLKTVFHATLHGDSMFAGTAGFSPTGKALMLLAGAVCAPIAEETLFRGVIFGGMAAAGYVRAGFIVSAVLFAAAHLSLENFIPLLVFGFVSAWLYRRTGTMTANITAHAVNNAAAFIVLFMGKG